MRDTINGMIKVLLFSVILAPSYLFADVPPAILQVVNHCSSNFTVNVSPFHVLKSCSNGQFSSDAYITEENQGNVTGSDDAVAVENQFDLYVACSYRVKLVGPLRYQPSRDLEWVKSGVRYTATASVVNDRCSLRLTRS